MLYRKVSTKKRVPTKTGYYTTEWGKMYFTQGTKHKKGGWSINVSYMKLPFWWLEKVKEPTDEEIEEKSSAKCKERMNAVWPMYQVGYEDGYKQACKDLIEE